MDKNSLERRFSLNTTRISNPIAESTCLNLNGTSSPTHFQWGGSSISPKNRSNSSICLANTSTSGQTHNGSRSSSASSPQRGRGNVTKIDPRMYADVQSKGLASRIVKYHENGARLSRSMSVNNLYNKPGQFPVVHLKKTELPYKASRQNLSMTRIAPPGKSMFYGNTLSSLLRSNSIVGLHKTDEEISRENRPILHPPPTESELAPTRSVLDVLKEISRKRINSDDLDGQDSNKKYCNREGGGAHEQSLADTIPPPPPPQINHLARHLNSAQTPQSYKRQREHIATPYYPHQLNHHHQKQLPATTASPSHVQSPPAQHSPEQIAKKRICTYNNDITSSLSSSMKHANNKRKLYDQLRTSPNSTQFNTTTTTAAAVTLDYEMHKKKMQRSQQQTDLRFEQLSKTLSCNTPITPIPATPLNQTIDGERPTASTLEAVPPQRTLSEPVYPTVNANKPKLTLFNKNYDTESSNSPAAESTKDTSAEEGEYAGIQFVKPKKSSSISGTKNPLIERTQKSKLAMMLCGLRGELYQGDDDEEEDETDARRMQKAMTTKTTTNTVVTEPVKTTPTTISFNANSILTPTCTASSGSAAASSSSASSVTTTIANTTLKMGNIVGINSLKAKETPATCAATTATTTLTSQIQPINAASPTTPVVSAAAAAVPQLGGFKFTPPSSTTTTTATSITPIKSSGASPLVGLKLTPPSAAVPAFSFGSTTATTTTATTTTATTTTTALPVLGGFSFGPTLMAKSSAPTTATTSTTPSSGTAGVSRFAKSSAPLMLFGSGNNSASVAPPTFGSIGMAAGVGSNTTTTTATLATSIATVTPTFGSIGMGMGITAPAAAPAGAGTFGMGSGNVTAAPSFGNFANSTSSKPLTFGSTPPSGTATEAAKTTSAAAPPAFGLPGGVFGTASGSNSFAAPAEKTFNFGATTKTATITPTVTSTPTPGGFSFGAATTAQHKPSAAAAPFSFGGSSSAAPSAAVIAAPATNSAFAAVVTSSSNTFSFGGATAATNTNAVTPSFAFGSANQAAANSASSIFGGALNNTSNVAAAAANPPPAFGSVISATTQPQQTSVFGSATAAPTSTSTPFAFGGKPVNSGGGFAFGANNPPQASTPVAASTNLFGSSPHTTTTTGIVKPSFSFSGAQTSTATDASKPSLFGTPTTSSNSVTAGSNNNTFGSLAATSNTNQNKTFAFGANSNNNNANNNIFGAAPQQSVAPNNSLKSAAGGFSFGGASAAPGPAQSMMQTKPAAATPSNAFAFGSPSNNINNTNNPQTSTNVSSPFAFGGSAPAAAGSNAAPKIGTANKTFTFGNSSAGGGGSAQSHMGGAANIFGSAIAAVSANAPPTAPGAFNFGGGSMAAPSPIAAVPNGNIFAPQLGTMAPGPDRPIRRATRRLQKP